MSVMREPSRPPVHDSAVARVCVARAEERAGDALQRVVVVAEDALAEDLGDLALARGHRLLRFRFGAVAVQVDLDLAAAGEDRHQLAGMRGVVRLQLLLDARLRQRRRSSARAGTAPARR